MLMDRTYEGDETRALGQKNGHALIVPPKKNRENLENIIRKNTSVSTW